MSNADSAFAANSQTRNTTTLDIRSRDTSRTTSRHSKRDQREMVHSPVSPITKTAHISHEQYRMQLMEADKTDARPPIEISSTRSNLHAINAQRAPKPRIQFKENERDNTDTDNVPSKHIVKEQAVDVWRSCRAAFVNAQRTKIRAVHFDALLEERLYPDWAHGMSPTPAHLLPLNEDKLARTTTVCQRAP